MQTTFKVAYTLSVAIKFCLTATLQSYIKWKHPSSIVR